MKVLHLLHLLDAIIFIIFVAIAYATITVKATELHQAEANNAPAAATIVVAAGTAAVTKPKFGAKITKTTTTPEINSNVIHSNYSVSSASNSSRGRSTAETKSKVNVNAPKMSRRFDSPGAPPAQLITQYEIPIVNKNSSQKRRGGGGSNSGQQRQRESTRSNSNRNSNRDRATNANASVGSNSSSSNRSSGRSRSSNKTVGRGGTSKPNSNLRKHTTTTSSTTTTTTTTTRPTLFGNFQLDNPFNFFTPNFWNFSNPPSTSYSSSFSSTKKPPKKYTPPPSSAAAAAAFSKEEKLNYYKPKATIKSTAAPTTTTTTTTIKQKNRDEGPFRIALPTLNFFNPPTAPTKNDDDSEGEKEKRNSVQSLRERFNCPRESEVRFQLFPKICKIDKDCTIWNRDEICCEIFGAKSCISGISKPLEETSHAPILGLIPRKCPTRPLAELWWEVKECETDMDCWPRLCCPDGRHRYCRTSQPELETVPVQVKRSFNYLTEYLECTPAPPPIFDLHPKSCTSTLDCFPNVCCQEAGLRHCRPPKKSVLTLMANFLNVDFVKRLTQNIVIK